MPWDSARAGLCFHDHNQRGHLQCPCSAMERLLSAQTGLQPAHQITADTPTLHRPCEGFWKSRLPASIALENSYADRAHAACMTCMACTPARQYAAATVLRIRAVQQTPTVTRRTGLFLALRLPEPAAPNQTSSSAEQPESAGTQQAALHRTSRATAHTLSSHAGREWLLDKVAHLHPAVVDVTAPVK